MPSQIVAAYAKNNQIAAPDLPKLIAAVYAALANASRGWQTSGQRPAVPIDRSITLDYLICLEDGRRLKMLKRYLCPSSNNLRQKGGFRNGGSGPSGCLI